MSKATKKAVKVGVVLGAIALALWLAPTWVSLYVALPFLALGVYDVFRNDFPNSGPLLKRYFAGNGLFTWLMSPVNVVMDILSKPLPKTATIDDLPQECRSELEGVLDVLMSNRDMLIQQINASMGASARGMVFFRWYGRSTGVALPGLEDAGAYVKTIGVSTFKPKTATKHHFGPLRITYRVLYTLTPIDSEAAYIEVGNHKHVWRTNPLFIFDDTLMHRSVNDTDDLRYAAFIDIMRPMRVPALSNAILSIARAVLGGVNRMLYKNWKMLDIEEKPATR